MMQKIILIGLIPFFIACTQNNTSTFKSALTGDDCDPDMSTFVPSDTRGNKGGNGNGKGGHKSPTGIPGDNIDDEHSGKVDCLWDGDSGQGNDTEDCAPPAGCDADGCCIDDDDDAGDDDGIDFDDGGEQGAGGDGGDGSGAGGGAGGDGSGGDGSGAGGGTDGGADGDDTIL